VAEKVSEARVVEALRPVEDPDLHLSIVDLGLVRGITVDPDTGDVSVDLTLTSPMCPLAPQIMEAARQAVLGIPGVHYCDINLVWDPPWDPRTDASDEVKAELGIWD